MPGASSNRVIATVRVREAPLGVAGSPDGSRVYVTNQFDSTVSVIDTTSNRVTATVRIESGPIGVAVSPDGLQIYVANIGSITVSVIDAATIEEGTGPVALGQFIAVLP
ncbi:MAG: YncE family protein [Deinococcus sp.]|nr:YncE family protein [Deinococcus sp.]